MTFPLLLLAILLLPACESPDSGQPAAAGPESGTGTGEDWPAYLGHPSSNQYSTLDQINTDNVQQLEVAWTYDTGDDGNYQVNNLIVDGVLYTATPTSRVIALDGATGEPLWSFDPSAIDDSLADLDQRGVMYWDDGDQGRILTSKGTRLFALNASTGELIESFGENGSIHLGDGMDVPGRPSVTLNTPGQIFEDLLIVGAMVSENVPGAVRAFDLRSGERAWIFHTLARPDEPGSETWPDNYLARTGGASDWSGLAIDNERGIVYISTETAGPDFYGEDRYGENLYANSLVALNARTGERLWHHQLVHHDVWDMDLPTPPTLLTVNHEGEPRDIVAQGTKMGLLYVFDRVSGEPIWPIEEHPAPASELPDMRTWPTQPFPTQPPPLTRQRYTEEDHSNISPKAAQLTEEVLELSGSYGSFPPPSLEQTIIFPGYDGGMEWGGSAADPDGILYVNVNEIPWFYQLVPTRDSEGNPLPYGETLYRIQCAACHGMNREGSPEGGFPALDDIESRWERDALNQFVTRGGGRMPAFDHLSEVRLNAIVDFLYGEPTGPDPDYDSQAVQPYVFRGFQRFQDDEGYPAIKPPWGTLNAVDLNTGTIKWKVPLGEYKELTERGIPVTGTENYGGPVVTAGGLIFIAASSDEMIRAFDKETGAILWEHELPFDGHSTPSTYLVDGKQYVVISAGGSKMKPVQGGELVVFALPE